MMDDQQRISLSHEQRLTTVESRVTTMEVHIPYLQNAIDKLTNIAEQQSKQGALTEQAVVALKEGQEQHSRHIEDLTKSHVATKTKLDSLWRILATIGSALLLAGAGYLFTLFSQHHP